STHPPGPPQPRPGLPAAPAAPNQAATPVGQLVRPGPARTVHATSWARGYEFASPGGGGDRCVRPVRPAGASGRCGRRCRRRPPRPPPAGQLVRPDRTRTVHATSSARRYEFAGPGGEGRRRCGPEGPRRRASPRVRIEAMRTRMHDDEILTDADLARRLLAEQRPEWAGLPLRQVTHHGTDHDVYRVGDDLSLRLPRTAWAAAQAEKEARLVPLLAPHVTLRLPVVHALGRPTSFYPYGWSVQSWLPGHDLVGRDLADDVALAADLAAFVLSLREVGTDAASPLPPTARGGDLALHDDAVADRIAELGERVDGAALRRAWQESRAAAPAASRCWTH